MLVPSNGDTNTKVYRLSPCPYDHSTVILLKALAEMLESAICTLVVLASIYLQNNLDQLLHNMASDHYKKPRTNNKEKKSLPQKWLMMQQGSVKEYLDSKGIQSKIWHNKIAVHSWERETYQELLWVRP